MTIEAPKASYFCRVIGTKRVAGWWSGSAFRSHPRGIFRENMLFTNEWSTYDYCSVKVATDPDAKLILGCKDSCAHGNPHPSVSSGDLVTVYRDGSWVADGPWCERVVAILAEVEREIAEIAASEKAEADRKQAAAKAEARAKLDAARAVFPATA